jgi:hypothetical protein
MMLSGFDYGCDRAGCTSTVRAATGGGVVVATDRQGTIHLYHDWAVAEQAGVVPYAAHYCGPGHAALAISEALGMAVQAARSDSDAQ